MTEVVYVAACRVLPSLVEHLAGGLVLAASAAAYIIFTLVIVDRAEVFGACDATWPLSCPRKAASLANIALISRSLCLRMQTNLLVEGICLQRRNEALLFDAHRVLLHRARGSVIDTAGVDTIQILK